MRILIIEKLLFLHERLWVSAGQNHLTGDIPYQIYSLKKLEYLNLSKLFISIGIKLSSLTFASVSDNNVHQLVDTCRWKRLKAFCQLLQLL